MKIKYKPLSEQYYMDKKQDNSEIQLQTEYFAIEPNKWQQIKDWIRRLWNYDPKYQIYADKITGLLEQYYNEQVHDENSILYNQHINNIHYIMANSSVIKCLIKHGIDDMYLEQRVKLIMFHVKAELCWQSMGNNPRFEMIDRTTLAFQKFIKKYVYKEREE